MVKLITTVAALRLVEQGKLSLEAPVPDIDPVVAAPQVLDGFDPAGKPLLRPAKRPISLHDLLTHTAGFVYRLSTSKPADVRVYGGVHYLPTEWEDPGNSTSNECVPPSASESLWATGSAVR
jgi:CubicO group peptidase (beta-lactamase class C family)